jgi:hypothetical protein
MYDTCDRIFAKQITCTNNLYKRVLDNLKFNSAARFSTGG